MRVSRMFRSIKDDRRVDKMDKIYLMIHFEVLQTFVPIVNQIIWMMRDSMVVTLKMYLLYSVSHFCAHLWYIETVGNAAKLKWAK